MVDPRRVRVAVSDRVAVVTLDDPTRRNALDLGICAELRAVFDDLESDSEVGAVVLTGSGTAFCAGADLSHLESSEREGLLAIYEGFVRIARSPLPTIAAVNGPAVGAGVNLALACDLRIVSPRAVFDTRFLELGIHPGGGHTWMLERLLGSEGAFALVVFGEVLEGEEAARRGLAWRCVSEDELLAVAQSLAGRAAAAPPELVRRTKETITAISALVTHEEAIELELDAQVWSIRQPAFQQRLAVMKERVRARPRPEPSAGVEGGGTDTSQAADGPRTLPR